MSMLRKLVKGLCKPITVLTVGSPPAALSCYRYNPPAAPLPVNGVAPQITSIF